MKNFRINEGTIEVRKGEDFFTQYCPYTTDKCGLWCPRCLIIDAVTEDYASGVIKKTKIGKTLVTCGGRFSNIG